MSNDEIKFGMDNEPELAVAENVEEETVIKKKPFATWEVDGVTYRLALETGVICQLESKIKKNLMFLLDDPDGIPPLGTMLTVVQGAMQKYHHGISFHRVQQLYDKYRATGKAQTEFFAEVFIPIFEVSGFFTEEMSEMMDESTVEI